MSIAAARAPAAAGVSAQPIPPPSVWGALQAPLYAVFTPARAAGTLAAAGSLPLALTGALWILFASVIALALLTLEAFVAAAIRLPQAQSVFGKQTLTDIWADWHPKGPLGIPEFLIAGGLSLGATGVIFAAWLMLPLVHRCGPVASSMRRAMAGGVALLGPICFLAASLGAILVPYKVYREVRSDFTVFAVIFLVVAGCAMLLIGWFNRIVAGLRRGEPAPVLPPLCERCGYDLTARALDSQCPECGATVRDSLQPDRLRGSTFNRSLLADFLPMTLAILATPRAFYARLPVRGDSRRATRFAVMQLAAIGCGAASWITVVLWLSEQLLTTDGREWLALVCGAVTLVALAALQLGFRFTALASIFAVLLMSCALLVFGELPPSWGHPDEEFYLIPLFACVTFVDCWFGHRVVAAIAGTIWMVRRELPDFASARHAFAYETAFLWVFCAWWAACMLGSMWSAVWPGDVVWLSAFTLAVANMPPQPFFVIFGTLALGLVWLWRYRVAGRAIRWSNF